jgi:putative hydrolase of the HAD superfamily
MFERIEAIAFDLYNTLVCIDEDSIAPWRYLNLIGYQSSPRIQAKWESDAFDGHQTPRLGDTPGYNEWRRANLRRFALDSMVPSVDADRVVQDLLTLDASWTVKAMDGAHEVLGAARSRGIRTAVCSNWDYPLEPYLKQANLGAFDATVSSAVVGFRKPNIRIFEIVCEQLQLPAAQIAFVGDKVATDVIGASRTGMLPVLISSNPAIEAVPSGVRCFRNMHELKSELI